MTFSRILLLGVFLFISSLTFAQTTDSASTKIIGKWLLVKHLLNENGTVKNKLTVDQTYTYEFFNDGTYKATFEDKKTGTQINTGKWKIENGKTLVLYESTLNLPDGQTLTVARLEIEIFKLTSTDLIIKQGLFSEFEGKSYYKKR
jgi:hypothetical protein